MTDNNDPIKVFQISPEDDVYIFAYGSLLWNPEFEYAEKKTARLEGFHRRFCLLSREYRGTPEDPGLVLGLDQGGVCHGAVYRLDNTNWDKTQDIMQKLWAREMSPPGVYLGKRISVVLDDGAPLSACTFVINHEHADYVSDRCPDYAAAMIAKASGARGTNRDYLVNTIDHLNEMGITDHGLDDILSRVQALS